MKLQIPGFEKSRLVFLYHKPVNHTETELKNWFDSHLRQIAMKLETDIAKDKKGEYPHAGRQTFEKRGKITYVLLDKNHSRFDISDKNMLTTQDIMDLDDKTIEALMRAAGKE